MTPEHKWLQSRVWRICVKIGYNAYPEDYATNADVYVPGSGPDAATGGGYAIEVQRVSTDVPHRTEARRAQGARTLWLLTDSIQGAEADRMLFRNPAIRIRAVDKEDKKTVLAPWDDPKLNQRAYLQVAATLAEYKEAQRRLDKSRGWRSGYTFLVQVLNGERTWHPASELRPLGLSYGAWVLEADIDKARAAVEEDRQREAQERKAEPERAKEATEAERSEPEAEPVPPKRPEPPRAVVVEPQPLPSPTPPRPVPQVPTPKPIAKPAPARPSPVTAQQPKQQAPSLLRSIRKLFGLD